MLYTTTLRRRLYWHGIDTGKKGGQREKESRTRDLTMNRNGAERKKARVSRNERLRGAE